MDKTDYIALYRKALCNSARMLEDAHNFDKAAENEPDIAKAMQYRMIATMLREYYRKMFD